MGPTIGNTVGTSTQWRSTLSSKVNLHHTINFGALCSATLVTRWSRLPLKPGPNETLELHRVAPLETGTRVFTCGLYDLYQSRARIVRSLRNSEGS